MKNLKNKAKVDYKMNNDDEIFTIMSNEVNTFICMI